MIVLFAKGRAGHADRADIPEPKGLAETGLPFIASVDNQNGIFLSRLRALRFLGRR